MCGRFALGGLARNQIRNIPAYNLEVEEWIDEERFEPRYNIAPRSRAPVVRLRGGSARNGANDVVLHTMKWGLVPHWSKFEDTKLNTINARSENLVEGGGMWGSIKGKHRCAVVCQGYYEWQQRGKDRVPHLTKFKDDRLMLMAGLFDHVVLEGETTPLWTFTIVTTSANKDFSWLHDRQPVFLSNREALDRWLDTSSQTWTPELTKMVEPYHDSSSPLVCYQVPKEVGKVGNESPTFIEPIQTRKDGIQAMFSRQRDLQVSMATPKRKRPSSPPAAPTSDKKTKTSKDSDVDDEDLNGSSSVKQTPKKIASTASASPSKSKGSPRKPKPSKTPSSPSKRIDEFFKKN